MLAESFRRSEIASLFNMRKQVIIIIIYTMADYHHKYN